eukprot:COSAG01_NODE_6659_length_3559_cov_49.560694_5_plen_101_part_00
MIDPSVDRDTISRFVLTAHKAKMDRTTSKSRDLDFQGGNRDLHRVARQEARAVIDGLGFEGLDSYGFSKISLPKKLCMGGCCCCFVLLFIGAAAIPAFAM